MVIFKSKSIPKSPSVKRKKKASFSKIHQGEKYKAINKAKNLSQCQMEQPKM